MIELYRAWFRACYLSLLLRMAWRKMIGMASRELTASLGQRMQIVGDDLLVTNPLETIPRKAIEQHSCNRRAHQAQPDRLGDRNHGRDCALPSGRVEIHHLDRSGETEDSFIADFAVAMGGGQIKSGSLCRSERIAKYNRLLEIEQELGSGALFGSPFA